MALGSNDEVRLVQSILSSVKHSIERSVGAPVVREVGIEQWQALLLKVEALRFRTALAFRRTVRSEKEWVANLRYVREGIVELLDDGFFRDVLSAFPASSYAPNNTSRYKHMDLRLENEKLTIHQSLVVALDHLDVASQRFDSFDAPDQDSVSAEMSPAAAAETIRRIVPGQKLSPLKFEVKEGKLTLVRQSATAGKLDQASADAARGQLVEQGAALIEQLSRSNCDPRLTEKAREVQGQLADNKDIIQLGLANLLLTSLQQTFENELPDAVGAVLRAHTAGIGMYVGQYPEWQRFVENASSVSLDESDIDLIDRQATKLIDALSHESFVVSPEVPRSLAKLRELLDDRRNLPKRAAFALIRSIENLASSVFHFGADFIRATVRKTSEALSTAVSKVVVIALLGTGLVGANALLPMAPKMAELEWVKNAVQVVEQQMKILSK